MSTIRKVMNLRRSNGIGQTGLRPLNDKFIHKRILSILTHHSSHGHNLFYLWHIGLKLYTHLDESCRYCLKILILYHLSNIANFYTVLLFWTLGTCTVISFVWVGLSFYVKMPSMTLRTINIYTDSVSFCLVWVFWSVPLDKYSEKNYSHNILQRFVLVWVLISVPWDKNLKRLSSDNIHTERVFLQNFLGVSSDVCL